MTTLLAPTRPTRHGHTLRAGRVRRRTDPWWRRRTTTTKTSDQEFLSRLEAIRDDITLPAQFTVLIARDKKNPAGRFYFQIEAVRLDTFTGKPGTGRGGKAYLSEEATDSELVQTIFGLYDFYCHHEVRETFLWRGRRVFGPHVDINAHWEVAERYDTRPTRTDG